MSSCVEKTFNTFIKLLGAFNLTCLCCAFCECFVAYNECFSAWEFCGFWKMILGIQCNTGFSNIIETSDLNTLHFEVF